MPQSLLDKMNYDQLKSLAESRGCFPTNATNSAELREAIYDWEIERGLPFKGLREIVTKNTETTDLSAIEEHLLDLKESLMDIDSRLRYIEECLEGNNNA